MRELIRCSIDFTERINREVDKLEEMGYGLAIAKTIVELHGGSIKALHNEPKGTIILIRL